MMLLTNSLLNIIGYTRFQLLRKNWSSFILANRPDLVGTVPTWKPKPDVSPDDHKKPICPDKQPKRDF